METRERLNIAYYCTGHGLGHATRVIEVARQLLERGHAVTIITAAPPAFFSSQLPRGGLSLRRAVLDTGAKQRDAFTVDQRGSLDAYIAVAVAPREAALSGEADWLRAARADLVVSDIVPLACAAAAAAGVPCVAVSNFSWDFVYSEYINAAGAAEYRRVIWQIADDYACAQRLLRLPGHVPMPAFREVVDVPLVVRKARRTRADVRRALGIPPDANLAFFMYGGQPAGAEWRLSEGCLPPGWLCVVLSNPVPGQALPPNFVLAEEEGAYTPDLVEACDVVVGKIGYGTASECLAHARPLVFLRRDFFNEEPFLRKALELAGSAVEMKRRDFLAGNWAPYLEAARALSPRYDAPTNGAEVVAALLERAVADARAGATVRSPEAAAQGRGGGSRAPAPRAGSARLRDTIAWGYCMARHAAREKVDVPDWYVRGHNAAPPSPAALDQPQSSSTRRVEEAPNGRAELSADGTFTVLQGPPGLSSFEDTLRFLGLLAVLDEAPASPGAGARELPERRAARGLFRWEDEVVVARAPGRLDVMGGIADYSGSLVLQMPIAQAAHVAVQRHPPGTQRVWRHMAWRHHGAAAASRDSSRDSSPHRADGHAAAAAPAAAVPGRGSPPSSPPAAAPPPALRIVSLNADATNRGPAFDMDLAELLCPGGGGEPMPYDAARAYFRRDPGLSWAAYVAGALVVLMHERGLRPVDGLSVLVESEVPEGKGVSSSAAVEVAAMAALAAAHGIELGGRELALLCQKVENLVVGAPCGVMDQMASALGQPGALLALRCQPAEVEGCVALPPHLRFWGIDSGIRHSVGGSDYGAVRVGAFMGLRIASQLAHDGGGGGGAAASGLAGFRAGVEVVEPLGRGYLANVPPSEFAARYERHLPETISGADFLRAYGSHWDRATEVDPARSYAVRQPAAHPVHENFRVQAFRQILGACGAGSREQLEALGELMLQSHVSYGACGLGSAGTDRLVSLMLEERAASEAAGQEPALYGAKITGGGSGGTVCVLGSADARGEAALRRVAGRYAAEAAHDPQIFCGTSAGAADFGVLRLLRKGGT